MTLSNDVIEMKIENIEKDISEMKSDIKEIKEMFNSLDNRFVTRAENEYLKSDIKTLKGNQSKIVWIIISAVLTTVLSLIFIK